MFKTILQFIFNTFGVWIIWYFILQNKNFDLYSKKGFYTFLLVILAVTLLKIKL